MAAPGVESAFPTPPSFYRRYANWTEENSDESLKPPPPLPLDEPLMLFGALAFPPANVRRALFSLRCAQTSLTHRSSPSTTRS
jgi:hypothetical protein